MAKGFGQADPEVVRYAHETFRPEDETMAAIREECDRRGLPAIQLGSFDARHLEVLTAMSGARRAVEIGTLGGYSGLAICRGMGLSGRLYTCELDPHHAEVAAHNFKRAGVEAQVEILVGPALENLPRIERDGPFDLVFIDADKANYANYLAWATDHLRVGGVVIADNTFAWNKIHRAHDLPPDEAKAVTALRAFNQELAESPRYRATILPTAEGLTVAVKIH